MAELSDDYLKYPNRGHGMDHDRYPWSQLHERPNVTWPNGARVALWVVTQLQWFPMDMKPAVPVPGAMARPYPDFWNYTLRDYGNRVGVYRIFKVLDKLGLKSSVAINSALAERHPFLIEQVNQRGWEVVANGLDMGHIIHGEMDREEEAAMIKGVLDSLRKLSGQPVRGWLSPIRSESFNTPDIAAANGIEYLCDWLNDDMPYAFETKSGTIHNLPHTMELDDQQVLVTLRHTEQEYVDQLKDQFDCLYAESAERGGRVMAINLNPWVTGQAYRIKALEEALSYISGHDGVWTATGAEILDAFKAQA
ncbi:MAG: polysaccharide deacetylase family protein [Rhodospirillaceae bacterium]|mgnify:FL=1|jgi:peptidoglycan/xylan/chitin deacetylase (PgdA/CDA1 family)|nr:polysaccharide deacetylase family protein [Rhodospirillaceae bacterium]MBT4690521.1 polysaccharide deacetylase family protein [Rhodospirillaceae bacterium]MBT5082371.1 polysaccharide deacetylase family protein [Rhodospirillaceae bacterium]MBT5522672.1 polysaccharide deacetylase family protein [Rhodospirillaceae bacterium]MBT5882243.1 polysaccharide deacetylase family protein [Rhodospirillaceae bacterium]